MKTVIKFSMTFCQPCKQLKPIFDEAVKELSDIRVVEIDADETPNIASNYKIRSVPTIIVTDENDVVLASHSGVMTKEQIIDFIKDC